MHFRQSLFWDIDPKKIDPERHAKYVIERILDFGNDEEVKWMWGYYSQTLLKKVIDTSKVLHPSSKSLWKLLVKTA